MKKKKDLVTSNTKIAVIFFAFLVFVVGISIALKVIAVVRLGQVNDSKRFTLSISNNRNLEIVSLSPKLKSISVIKLDRNIKPSEAGQLLGIPIDGFITADSLDLSQKVNSIFFRSALNYKSLKTNITIIDILKLLFFARTVPESAVIIKNIPSDLSTENIDKIVGRLVGDELIEKDNQTIQIINGTSMQGAGSRLARLVTNMGGDVIIVATSDNTQKKSMISYTDKKTYTVERLSKVLGYEIVKNDNAISDITITIGEDKINYSVF